MINEPTTPQNFDFAPRYISNLPLDRVKEIRDEVGRFWNLRTASSLFETIEINDSEWAERFAGYILQLTELNNEQK